MAISENAELNEYISPTWAPVNPYLVVSQIWKNDHQMPQPAKNMRIFVALLVKNGFFSCDIRPLLFISFINKIPFQLSEIGIISSGLHQLTVQTPEYVRTFR